MNYKEQLKAKETKLTNIKAKALAKLQSAKETLDKKNKLEAEAQSKFNLSLSEIPSKINEKNIELSKLTPELEEIIKEIESKLAKINC
jgi:hypothetical protein